MITFALDTNIVSYILRGQAELMNRINSEIAKGNHVAIPPIVYYEVKRGLKAIQAPEKLAAFERLCGLLGVDGMDRDTLDVAADIYADQKRRGRPVDDPDILIAASCIAQGYTLVTNNMRHFEVINGLKVENWVK